jgi:hypothetical protein
MITKKTVAAGLVALASLTAAAPASADDFSFKFSVNGPHAGYHDGGHKWRGERRGGHDRHYGTLTPQEVRRVLRDKGYRQINYVDRRGRIYEVRATNHRGHRVGLVVSARNGAVLNAYRL